MPRLLPTHPVAASFSMPWESLATVEATRRLIWEVHAPRRASASAPVTAGRLVQARGFRRANGTVDVDGIQLVAATAAFGASFARLLAPTTGAELVGGVIGFWWGNRQLRRRGEG
jgi:hypothetical protein